MIACLEYRSIQFLKDDPALEGNLAVVTAELLVNLRVNGERFEKARSIAGDGVIQCAR